MLSNNSTNLTIANMWLAADMAAEGAQVKGEYYSKKNDLAEMLRDIEIAQEAAIGQRGWWNTGAGIVGCAVGGIAGLAAGPMGILAGCSTGAKVGSTAMDWLYDSSFDFSTEAELQILEDEIAALDMDLSDTKYYQSNEAQVQDDLDTMKEQHIAQYDKWLNEDFYGKTDLEYIADFGVIGLEYIGSKAGQSITEHWAKSHGLLDTTTGDWADDWYKWRWSDDWK
jgi:hypothetical protein